MADAAASGGTFEPAPAKINLYLHVGKRRADGYHELESLIVFTAFGDAVRIAPSSSLELVRDGMFADALPGEVSEDLCCRAAEQLAAALDRPANVRISLSKNIPVAAGGGGGSADAAAVLRALCRIWDVRVDDPRVVRVAGGLGADVPVCLLSRSAHVRGIGEQVTPADDLPELHLLLVNPNVPLSTASVFGAYRPADGGRDALAPDAEFSPAALRDGTRNDLGAPAVSLCPGIADVLAALDHAPGCRLARMSGSGPTCFAVFDDAAACAAAAAAIARARPDWWVCPTHTTDG